MLVFNTCLNWFILSKSFGHFYKETFEFFLCLFKVMSDPNNIELLNDVLMTTDCVIGS